MMSQLVVKELTPSLKDDFLSFFDSVAFADNPDWSDCYCSAYHFANKGKAESRREASSLIEVDSDAWIPCLRQRQTSRLVQRSFALQLPCHSLADGSRTAQGRE